MADAAGTEEDPHGNAGGDEDQLSLVTPMEWLALKDPERDPMLRIPCRELTDTAPYQIRILTIDEDGMLRFLFEDSVAQSTRGNLEVMISGLYPSNSERKMLLLLKPTEIAVNMHVVAKIVDSSQPYYVRGELTKLLPRRNTAIVKCLDYPKEHEVRLDRLYSLTTKIAAPFRQVMRAKLEEVEKLPHPKVLEEIIKRYPIEETLCEIKFCGRYRMYQTSKEPLVQLLGIKDDRRVFHAYFMDYLREHASYVMAADLSIFEDASCFISCVRSDSLIWVVPNSENWVSRILKNKLRLLVDKLEELCRKYPFRDEDFDVRTVSTQFFVYNHKYQMDGKDIVKAQRIKILDRYSEEDVIVRLVDHGWKWKVPLRRVQPINRLDESLSFIPPQALKVLVSNISNDLVPELPAVSGGETVKLQVLDEESPPTVRFLDSDAYRDLEPQ